MTTEQYENEIPRNYYLRVDGYNNKNLTTYRLSRKEAYIGLIGQVDVKKLPYEVFCKEIYPLPGDEFAEPETIIMTPEKMAEIQAIHNKFVTKKKRK